jgi:hypothetical protein
MNLPSSPWRNFTQTIRSEENTTFSDDEDSDHMTKFSFAPPLEDADLENWEKPQQCDS